jgi:hypothetical protein
MRCTAAFCYGLISFLFLGCAVTTEHSSSVKHVENFEMEVPAAPEVRGASGYMEHNSSSIRLSAKVHTWKQEKETLSGITNEKKANYSEYKNYNVQEDVDGTYKIIYPYLTASIEYMYKIKIFLLGMNVSINRGILSNVSVGVNTRYFEAGLFGGLWIYANEYDYSGTVYVHKSRKTTVYDIDGAGSRYGLDDYDISSSNHFESSSPGSTVPFGGGYASAYYGPLSLNFSISLYYPNISYESDSKDEKIQSDFNFPCVMTEYITLGYRLNKQWEFRLGTANVFGDFPGWHWSATGGFSYYLK